LIYPITLFQMMPRENRKGQPYRPWKNEVLTMRRKYQKWRMPVDQSVMW